MVERHLAARPGRRRPTSFEPELLGAREPCSRNRDWIAGEEMFLACNADNLTDFDLRMLVEAHGAGGVAATLTVFRADQPSPEADRRAR